MEEEKEKIKQQYNIEKENESIINDLVNEIMNHSTDAKFLMDFTQKIREYRNKIYELKVNLGDNVTEAYKEKKDTILEELKEELERHIHTLQTSVSVTDFMDSKEEIELVCRKAINWKKYPINVIFDKIMNYKEECVYIEETRKSIFDDDKDVLSWHAKNKEKEIITGMTKAFLEGIYQKNEQGERKLNMKKLINYASGDWMLLEGYKGNIEEVKEIEKNAIENVNISKAVQVFQYYEKQIAFWQEMNLKKIREESTKERYFE